MLDEQQLNKFHELYGKDCKLSKIYNCKDGRKRLDIICSSKKKTVQLARLILEITLNRKLETTETVDHIDGDPTNDIPSNLRPLSKSANSLDSVKMVVSQKFQCPYCKNHFILSGKKIADSIANRKKGKSGPFCSKSCAGKYGAALQNAYINKIEIFNVQERKYYTLKDM